MKGDTENTIRTTNLLPSDTWRWIRAVRKMVVTVNATDMTAWRSLLPRESSSKETSALTVTKRPELETYCANDTLI